MPFTLSHPAAVIFLRNKYLNFMGLILGSMSPDYIYFILFRPSSNIGHTLLGMILLNLPLCFVINFLFDVYIKESLILNLPNNISKQYNYLIKYNNNMKDIKSIIVFIYSAFIGMFTHIFWDSFTHKSGFFVNKISFLNYKIHIMSLNIPVYKFCQHFSTIIGTIIIIIYLYKIRNINGKLIKSKIKKIIYYFIVFITVVVVLLVSFIYFKIDKSFGIGTFVVTAINGTFIGMVFAGHYYIRNKS
ncbi:DUF4184 family protein [Romboutsia maritimum]|uniref:DUF4184 family protein n=1 Tax=Romboutsia maritimum TaxID=2020948 RepID=A0A371IVS5_9FIRM|nr:DUF4184 family protein [Romboutsia maritimum]RDY24569.1 DUF4184 family protein [Romboutsia maritimum]